MKKAPNPTNAESKSNGRAAVLIVDTDRDERRRLSQIFEKKGYRPVTVGTGAEALAAARQSAWSAVLLTIELSDTPGTELIAPLRKICPDAAIIMLTAHPTLETSVRSINEGADGYIIKSPSADEIVAQVEEVVGRRCRATGDVRPQEDLQRELAERIKTEGNLLRAANEWRITFDSITDLITIQDADYRILRVNRAMADFLKTTPKALIGKRCYEVVHGTKEPPSFCPRRKVFETGRSAEVEVFEPRLGLYLHVVDSPIFDANGNVTGSVHVIKDITDRKRAEEALRGSEARYRRLFESATVGIFHSLVEGRYLRVNPAMARIAGFDSPEQMVASVKDIARELYVDPGQRSPVVEKAIRTGEWVSTEGQFRRKDGQIRWGRQWVHPVLNPDGTVNYLEGFVEDITDSKTAEETIRANERNLSMAQRIAAVGSWDWDLVANKLVWSEQTYRIFGRDPASYTPVVSDALTSVHPDDLESLEKKVRDCIDRNAPYEHEYRVVATDGTTKHVRAVGEVVQDSQGNPIRLRGAIQDVTERKQREDAVREWKERYELVVAASGQAAYDYRVPTGEIIWGPTMEQLLGYGPEEYGGGLDQWIKWLHPDDKEETLHNLAQVQAACSFWDAQYRLRHKDGHYVWVRDRGYFIPDKNGKAVRQLGMLEDITERKRAEEALRQSEERHRTVLETMEDGYFELDLEGNFTAFNESMRRMLGYEQEKMIGLNYRKYMSKQDAKQAFTAYNAVFRTGVPSKVADWRLIREDGMAIDIETSISLRRDSSGAPIGFFSIARDVTERKLMEKALRESDIRFRKLSANVPGMIYQFLKRPDGTYCVPFTSEGIKDIFGCRPEDVREDFSPITKVILPEDLDRVVTSIESSADGMTLWQCEYRAQVPGGPVKWLYGQSTPEKLADGSIIWHGFNTDVTEHKRAEEALVKSESLLNATQRLTKVGGWEWSVADRTMYWTDEINRIHGIDAAAMVSGLEDSVRSSIECYDPEDRPVILAAFNRCLQEGVPYDLEFPFTTYRGDRIWIRTTAEAVREDGKIVRVIGTIMDITERKQAEDALRQSEEQYRSLVETINDVLFTVAVDGTITYMSPAVETVTGYSADDYVGRNFTESIHPDDLPALMDSFARSLQGAREEAEFRVVTKGGSYRHVRSSSNAIAEGGSVVGLSGLITDITERKRVEEALRESEEKFRDMFQTSRDFLSITDLAGNVIDVNESGLAFFGYSAEDLASFVINDLYDDPKERKPLITTILEKGFLLNHEVKLKKKSGEIIDALVTVNIRRDADGNPIGFFASAKDITEKKRLELQLLQSEKLSAVGTMISGVAHELNNPLTSIIGNAQLLSKRDVPDDIRAKLDTILRESKRSSKIVGGLLAFAREHKPERKMTDVNEILAETLKLREYDLKVSNIDVRTSFADDLPETYADPYQLQQVFINVINNARDVLAGRDRAALAIRSYRKDKQVIVEIEDNGPGIPDTLITKIFDPFFTTKDVGKGTGLGLSMAYGIIKEHNGTISVESKPDKGAKFSVTLPIVKSGRVPEEKIRTSRQAPPGSRSVLVVEDEESLRDLLSDALTEAGFFVEAAPTGQDAIHLIGISRYDAVVSDIKMPGIGGRELYLYIQKHHPQIADKIVFITGDILSKDTQSFLQITNNRFIEKPFNIDVLVAMLHDIVLK